MGWPSSASRACHENLIAPLPSLATAFGQGGKRAAGPKGIAHIADSSFYRLGNPRRFPRRDGTNPRCSTPGFKPVGVQAISSSSEDRIRPDEKAAMGNGGNAFPETFSGFFSFCGRFCGKLLLPLPLASLCSRESWAKMGRQTRWLRQHTEAAASDGCDRIKFDHGFNLVTCRNADSPRQSRGSLSS